MTRGLVSIWFMDVSGLIWQTKITVNALLSTNCRFFVDNCRLMDVNGFFVGNIYQKTYNFFPTNYRAFQKTSCWDMGNGWKWVCVGDILMGTGVIQISFQ